MTGLDWMYIPTPNTSTITTRTTSAKTAPSTILSTQPQPEATLSKPMQPARLRPHPGHEAIPWDSPIEDPSNPLPLSHHPHNHHHRDHHHDSDDGVSLSESSHPPSPGFEVPWDSPISDIEDEEPLTPVSEIEGDGEDKQKDYFGREASAAPFASEAVSVSVPLAQSQPQSQQQGQGPSEESEETPEEEKQQEQSETRAQHQHPALGQTDGAFGRQKRGDRMLGCGLTDGVERGELMFHICGLCGCGRKEIMTPRSRRVE